MSSKADTPELAVVIPLEDPRGDVVEHLRTWTEAQTFDRRHYQLVLGANGEHPDFERHVATILAPQDRIVTASDARLMGLYDAAARAATAPILVLTEAHCTGHPECLETVAAFFERNPDLDAATFDHRQDTSGGSVSELGERWFARVHAVWAHQDLARLNPAGSAIRAEAYARIGGLEPPMELFAPSFISARLAEGGGRVGHISKTLVTHTLENIVREDMKHARSFARGDCYARTIHDPEIFQRYFGSAGLFDRRLAYRSDVARQMVLSLLSAAKRSPRDARWIAQELLARLPARLAGPRPRIAWERTLGGLNAGLAGFDLVPFERRWRSYAAATEHQLNVVRLQRGAEASAPEPVAGPSRIPAERLDGTFAGIHWLESDGHRAFRWTEPVAMVRIAAHEGAVLALQTGAIRGDPLDYLHGVSAGGRWLPHGQLDSDGETLRIKLDPEAASAASEYGLVLICRPLVPSDNGSSDRRRLGMPVTDLEVRPA